jgi:hypothetical protein
LGGAAWAQGEWTNTGGSASHQQYSNFLGLPPSSPSNVNLSAGGSVTDWSKSIVIGPQTGSSTEPLDIWGTNADKLYRFNFTPGTGLNQLWNVTLPPPPFGGTPRSITLAVDDNRNSYVMYGPSLGTTFYSYDSTGAVRSVPGPSPAPSFPWTLGTGEGHGPAVVKTVTAAGTKERLLWGAYGTEIPDNIGSINVWDSSGYPRYYAWSPPPAATPPNHREEKVGVTGLPAAGPGGSGSSWTVNKWGYFPVYWKKVVPATGVKVADAGRIYRADLSTEPPGNPTLFYNVGAANVGAIATDDIVGSATRGWVFAWTKTGGNWSVLAVDQSGVFKWSVSASPAAAVASGFTVEPEPVAIGSSYVYVRAAGFPGTVMRINKSTGAVSNMSPTFTSVGPITIGRTAAGVEHLCFKDGNTLNVRDASNLNTVLFTVNLLGTGNTAVPIGLAPQGASLKPVVYSWGMFTVPPFPTPDSGMRAFYAP